MPDAGPPQITEEQFAAMVDRCEFLERANDRAHQFFNDSRVPKSYRFHESRFALPNVAWKEACVRVREETGRCPMEALVEEEAWLRGPEMCPVLHIDHLDDDGNPVYEKRK